MNKCRIKALLCLQVFFGYSHINTQKKAFSSLSEEDLNRGKDLYEKKASLYIDFLWHIDQYQNSYYFDTVEYNYLKSLIKNIQCSIDVKEYKKSMYKKYSKNLSEVEIKKNDQAIKCFKKHFNEFATTYNNFYQKKSYLDKILDLFKWKILPLVVSGAIVFIAGNALCKKIKNKNALVNEQYQQETR